MRVYLDNAATTRVDPAVAEEMKKYLTDIYGNASSLHAFGREAREALERARESIAKKINANANEIVFTSGGTESDNLAIQGICLAKKKGKLLTSTIEHPAVNNTMLAVKERGFGVVKLAVDSEGFLNLDALQDELSGDVILVSIIHGNNEIGTVQDMKAISEIVHDKGSILHMDCVQSFTKVPIDVKKTGVDMISMASHKIHGPKGVGALFVREGIEIEPLFYGGPHEFGKRPGTENVAGAVAFAKAAELMTANEISKIKSMRDYLVRELLEVEDSLLNGPGIDNPNRRLVNNANITFKYIEGESLLYKLDDYGIAVSTGSACSSRSLKPSHVLSAIGLDHKIIHGTVRMTFGRFNSMEETKYAVEKIKLCVDELRQISPFKHSFDNYDVKG
ncbi:cysteine desulfurase NifS [Candidatus Micrarchaeota archaeon]|nr:MAG: cysteine desulfurase NifS [Candidatus Micrarchaeota archaeon]